MSYDNPQCHGVISTGRSQGQNMIYDQYHMADRKTLEFSYAPGDSIFIEEQHVSLSCAVCAIYSS
eukprot:COSAG04_NODE_132_length_24268_cov_7.633426_4_plen_65_part_00